VVFPPRFPATGKVMAGGTHQAIRARRLEREWPAIAGQLQTAIRRAVVIEQAKGYVGGGRAVRAD